jgi:LysM repeat protein
MGWLDSIFGATDATVQGTTVVINTAQVLAFRALLDGEPGIRMYVGTGGSVGNQSATVNLLRRLTNPVTADNLTYGYAGIIDVFYEGGQVTLDKLYDLLPELHNSPHGQVNNATVNLIPYDAAHPPAQRRTFGFTGAVDTSTTNYATPLNVDYFVQLQPYNYNYAEKIWFLDARPAVDLRTVPELNDPSFARRVSYLPPATYNAPNWGDYAGDPRAQILQYLTGDDVLQNVRLVVSYAIMPAAANVINGSPEAAAAILCGGALAWQDKGNYQRAQPVVVLNLNRFGAPGDEAPITAIKNLLEGGMTPFEVIRLTSTTPQNVANAQQIRQVFEARSRYMKSLDSRTRFSTLNYPTSLVAVQNAVNAIVGQRNRVLFIQLGPVAQPLFYYALYRTNMVSLFEGANTTMAAINMGNPFLALPRNGAGDSPSLYPNVNRGRFSASPPINAIAAAANRLNFDLMSWPTGLLSTNPVSGLGAFLQTLTNETQPTDPIRRYFQEVKNYYAVSAADKVNVAFAYLMNLYQVDHPPALALARNDGDPEPDPNPLNALYAELEQAVVIGQKLDLIPGVLAGGNIAQVILDILRAYSATLWMTVATFEHDGDPTDIKQIRLTGTTGVLQDLEVTNAITVVFDAPDNQLRAGLELGSAGTWSIAGVPWIQMSRPYLRVLVSDGQIPVTAAIGGTYDPLGAQLQVLIPVADGQWLTTVSFERPYPSIDRAFQMAASVNLVQVLPPPLNTLVDLGLSQLDLYYEDATRSVPAIGFLIASNTDKPLPLVGQISLSEITAQVAILTPKTELKVNASASASFTIGTGPEAGVVAVEVRYPDFIFNGKLASGKIKLADLLSLFLPGVSLALLDLPTIDAFDFNYTQATDNLATSMKLVFTPPWQFVFFGKPLFTLEDVGFAIARSKGENTGSITATTTLLPDMQNPLVVGIGAYYLAAGTWRFAIEQQQGTTFSINELLEQYLGPAWVSIVQFPDVSGLRLQLDWGDKQATSFEFAAATASAWTPIPVLPDVTVTGKLKLGHRNTAPAGSYGELGADITLWNIKLGVSYNFDPEVKQLEVRWLSLIATIGTNKDGDTIATFSIDNKSVGELVETFVSWATGAEFGLAAPWNVLNSITLNGVKLIYNFTKKQVSFDIAIGPMDFGLFKIKGIGLKYDPDSTDQKVEITIDGSFVWESGDKLSWDPTKPETTPAPPGGGNKYLDLRLAALGQHVTVPGLTEQRRVQDVIAMLRKLEVPNPPEIPVGGDGQPVFAPNNSWFVAFDFGVLKAEEEPPPAGRGALVLADPPPKPAVYFLQLSTVFNDPTLYALRIALDGPMAKIFAGLDFQILYRQVSDTVGCYSAKIALPDLMRKFQIGVATITLPDFGIDVYTNGDFQVDIGFPWNQDFSRSFTIELIVPPGIPVLGSAGFYFGKLSSATSDKVPVRTTGWFNPVLVFGFGAQIGLGKSIEAGILRAGFSITVFGIIEGVIARWLPYDQPTTDVAKDQLQDGYYFSITGTMGIQGRLYGSIDFAIIKADVDVEIKIFARITFAAYEDIPIQASASVKVSVSVKINLGLFKITISFSFSARIDATFVLANPMKGPPPWGYSLPAGRGLSTRRQGHAVDELHERRLRRARIASDDRRLRAARATAGFNWDNLLPGTTLELQGWTAPILTAAGDRATTAAAQDICYVASFFLATPAPLYAGSSEVALQAGTTDHSRIAHAALARSRARRSAAAGTPATFEDLSVRVVQWAIAATQSSPLTPDQVDALVVTDQLLDGLLQYLSGVTTPTPIPDTAVDGFLTRQAAICFAQPSSAGAADGVFFPAPPGTRLQVADYGTWQGFDYAFGGYNTTDPGYLDALNTYFKQLQVQIGAEGSPRATARAAQGDGPSIASYVFGDYFTSLASQAVQALRDGLANFKLVIDDALGLQGIADHVNETGQLTGADAVTPGQLAVANQDHLLSTAASGPLTIPGMHWQAAGGQSFTAIAAQPIFGGGFTARALAELNADDARVIAANQTIVLDSRSHVTQTGDSLTSIARALETTLTDLLDHTDVLTSTTLIQALAVLAAPSFGYRIAAGDTLRAVGGRFGVAIDAVAEASAGVTHLFDRAADPNLNVPQLLQYQVGALIDEARRTLALQNLGAMMSRYYLHGLRLPTRGLNPKARGLFVTGGPGNYSYPAEMGLFGLTGQAFPLPAISDPATGGDAPIFHYTLTRGDAEGWLSLGTPGSAEVTFELTHQDDYQRYASVAAAAHGGPLATQIAALGASPVAAVQPARFPLSTELPWQTPVAVVLPHQPRTPATPDPRLWNLPGALINTPHDEGALPCFEPVLARTDQASGATVDERIGNYGLGSLISFAVRKIAPVEGSPTSERLYEIIGAPDRDIVLLERMLEQLGSQNDRFQQVQILYRPATTGSDVKGWQMDAPDATLAGIAQVNLSTDTQPGVTLTARAAIAGQPANLINPPLQFLRLLWEASITRQGGFYLGYSTGIGSDTIRGLPDHAFNDRGEAELAVLSLFTADAAVGQQLASYMNIAATNEPLDTSDAALIARAVVVAATTAPLAGNATLAAIAAAYYTGVDRVAALNASATLADGVTVTAAGGVYEVSPAPASPGGDLQKIADHFLTTVDAIKRANPNRSSWPDPLPVYTGLALPDVAITVGRAYTNGARFTSLADIAAYYHAPLAELAAANAAVPGMFPARATVAVEIGPTELTSVTPPGVAGVDLARTAPPDVPDDPANPDWGRLYLLHFFNLLGYRMADTPDFVESNWGLAGGPGDPDAPSSNDKIRAPRLSVEGDSWRYTRTLPYAGLAKAKPRLAVLPSSAADPYWGVGGLLQTELMWLDLFGNKILTDLDVPSSGGPLNYPPQRVGYTDRLLGVGQWPGVANAFRIAPDDKDQPAIVLSLAFDQSAYTDTPREKIEQAIAIYTQILQQLNDANGVTLALSTTVTPGADSVLTAAQAQAIRDWVAGIYAWLSSLVPDARAAVRSLAAGFTPTLDVTAALDVTRLNDAQIFLVTATFSIARRAGLVNGELDAVAGVRRAATELSAWTGPLTGGDTVQRDLTAFSADFTRALSVVPDRSYRVAAGSTRNVFTSGDARDVWAVQLGTTANQAISYRVNNPGAPIQYAPRPLSNQLTSKPKTPIIPYTTGKVIEPDDPSENRSFTSIDLDQWMSSTLGQIDALLTPRYVAPAQILRSKTGVDALQLVLDAKQALAKALQVAMIAVFADEDPTSDQLQAIRDVFYQRMLAALSSFYTVRAGLQFQATVTSAIRPLPGDLAPPRLYGDILSHGLDGLTDPKAGSISLTSPKLTLDLAGGPPTQTHDLSFLLSSAGLDAKAVTLDLSYRGQAIEHEIGEIAGIAGYQPSSWLSFADTTQTSDWPLTQPLGKFDTPIVLREFPETPALLVQEVASGLACPCYQPRPPAAERRAFAAGTCAKPGTYNPLSDVTRWSYRFRYSMQAHHEQDAVHGTISFNISTSGGALRAAAAPRDLFDNLAQFVEVYPSVLADLDTYLSPIDVTTTDPTQLANANAALISAAHMIQWIADSPPPVVRARFAAGASAVPPYTFVLTQDGVVKTGPSGDVLALRVTLKLDKIQPPGVGAPFVEVEPELYECGPESAAPGERSFVYKDRITGDYLTLEKGLAIAARGVVLPDMDILERQDAGVGIYLARNEELVDGRPSAPPFIYQTPLVELPAPLHPTLDSETPVDLATIYAVDPKQPVRRSLSCQLAVLYEALFANAGTDSVTLTVTVYYSYAMHRSLSKVRLPVYLQPPTRVKLDDSGTGISVDELVALQAQGIEEWFADHRPDPTAGTIQIDLTVMSNLTAQPMPSLRLRSLYVDLTNIVPPPGNAAGE